MYKYGKFENVHDLVQCMNSYDVKAENIIKLEYLQNARVWVLIFLK